MMSATRATVSVRASGNARQVTAKAQGARPELKRTEKAALAALSAAAVMQLSAGSPAMAGDLALGEQVFTDNCAVCHSGGKNVLIPTKTLQKDAIDKYLEGGFNLNAILYQINNGKGQMPAWEGTLEDDEIAAVAEYVYATASANGW